MHANGNPHSRLDHLHVAAVAVPALLHVDGAAQYDLAHRHERVGIAGWSVRLCKVNLSVPLWTLSITEDAGTNQVSCVCPGRRSETARAPAHTFRDLLALPNFHHHRKRGVVAEEAHIPARELHVHCVDHALLALIKT